MTEKIIEKALKKHNLTFDEVVVLLKGNGEALFRAADETRKKFVGDEVHLRGLIEFSNICKSTCKYCGLRSENKEVERYRLTKEEIISIAKNGADMGYKTIVLQSGEDVFFDSVLISEIVREIKKFNIAVTLSIGERSFEDYKKFKEAGADRYLIRIETTDRNLYSSLHPKMDFENRLRCLRDLQSLGYETGSGCLVGLPKQTVEMLARDILFFKENNFDMIGIGPFIPHPNTPLKDSKSDMDNFEMSLKVMAIIRLLLPDINIPATTAMETLNPNGRIIALKSGANVVMPNLTTKDYRPKYEIYPNKICINDSPDKCRGCIEAKIKLIGRTVSSTLGFRKKQVF